MKTVPMRDFVYLCIILGTISISLTAILIVDKEMAFSNLSFAATVVSIVLAVIAIIFTLINSTEQKRSIFQLKEITDEWKDSTKDATKLVQNMRDRISEIEKVNKSLINKIVDFETWRDDLLEQIKSLRRGENEINPDELNTKLELLEQKFKSYSYGLNNESPRTLYFKIKEYLDKSTDPFTQFDELATDVARQFGITHEKAREIIRDIQN